MGGSPVYEVVALRRRPQAKPDVDEGIAWGQRLAGLVAEAPPGARIEVFTWGEGARLRIALRCHAPGAPTGPHDLAREAALLLDPAAAMAPAVDEDLPGLDGTVLRILPRGAASDLRDIGFTHDSRVNGSLWAEPRATRSHELARLLLSYPGTVLVQSVEALTEDDVDTAREQSLSSVMGVGPSLDDLVGTPARAAAALVFPTRGIEPLRLREHLRGWFNILDLELMDHLPQQGEGTVAPEWMAAGLLRFPTTSSSAFPGLAVEPARVPLGTPAALSEGIRIGAAVDVSGREHAVRLPPDVMARHVHVLGETGSGKSTLLTTMAVETAISGEGLALIDPHGHTVDRVLRALPAEARVRTWVIRCGDPDNPVRLNPFSVSESRIQDLLISDLVDAFQVLFDPANQGIVGPRFMHSMRYALLTLAEARGPRASLLDVPRLFSDAALRRALLQHVHDPDVLAFWANDISNNRSNELNELIAWISSKFTTFASNRVVTQMLATGEDSFDPAEAMQSSRIVLIDLGKGAVGATGARMVGLIYLLRFWSAALASKTATPFTLFIDEAHTMSALTLPSILAEGRKFGLRAVLAHQYLGQLDPRLTDALKGSAGSRVSFRVGADDAEDLAQVMGPEFGSADLTSLPRGTAAARIADPGAPLRPFTLLVPDLQLSRTIGSAAAVDEVEAASRRRLVDPYRDARRFELADLQRPVGETGSVENASGADEPSFLDAWLERRREKDGIGSLPRPDATLLRAACAPELADRSVPAYVLKALLDVRRDSRAERDEAEEMATDLVAWCGLTSLPPSASRAMAVAVHDELSLRVGSDIASAAPEEAQDASLALDEAGDPDPMAPLLPYVDVEAVVRKRRFELMAELLAVREEILLLTDAPLDSPSDAWAVLAEESRRAMTRPPGDTTPPDANWVAAARQLIGATSEMSGVQACLVSLAVLDAVTDLRPHPELVDMVTRQAETANESDAGLALMTAVHRVAPLGREVDIDTWRRHRDAAKSLLTRHLHAESGSAYRYTLALRVTNAGVPHSELAQTWLSYADCLAAQGAWIGAEAARWAADRLAAPETEAVNSPAD